MRLLTTIVERVDAKTLRDALYADGVATTVKETRDGEFAVWVQDEDRLAQAREFLAGFDPHSPQVEQMAKEARARRREEAKADERLRVRTENIRRRIEARQSMRVGPVTVALMVICVLVFVYTGMGDKTQAVADFTFTPLRFINGRVYPGDVSAIWQGQPWRLVSPMFLHFGFLHIAFNLWWLKDLGTAIERVFSSRYLLALVLCIGVFSHILEYEMSGPTMFGGMSGVVYGLFAFIWLRGRLDPGFPYRMPQQLVTFMLIWLGLGFTGWVGNIANWVHLGGLLAGAAWAALSSGIIQRKLH
ncbi:MAG: rhomboid family intramembrane serine protease [Polyangiales bacterium]